MVDSTVRSDLARARARSRRMRASAIAAIALAIAACSHRETPINSTPHVTVYFCRAGTDTLVPMPFSANPRLEGEALESALVAQLMAGPAVGQSSVVMFPEGTRATVEVKGDAATVNLTGAIAKPFRGGASDEIALFKSLTYTMTSVDRVRAVQVLVGGRVVPTLPGGEFELDEPLTRETFNQ